MPDFVVELPEPEEAAYGRVTNPDRYRLVHDVADRMVQRLARRYIVSLSDVAAGHDGGVEVLRAVQLQPETRTEVPLVVMWTSFPGIVVQSGSWRVEAYPPCGCDACDDPPERVAEQLEMDVEMLVRGGLREEIQAGSRPRLSFEVGDLNGTHRRSWEDLGEEEVRRHDGPAVHDWHPWTRRTA